MAATTEGKILFNLGSSFFINNIILMFFGAEVHEIPVVGDKGKMNKVFQYLVGNVK